MVRARPGAARGFVYEASLWEGEGCLDWPYATDPGGYGKLGWEGKIVGAHRVVLFLATGVWGEAALHSCDRPVCVAPGHLRWGSRADNYRDMVGRGRSRGFETRRQLGVRRSE